jgi:hypothetical protein
MGRDVGEFLTSVEATVRSLFPAIETIEASTATPSD